MALGLSASKKAMVETGRQVLKDEAKAVLAAANGLGESFIQMVDRMGALRGRVVVVGVGKSGLVGRKIAATFSSTGTPALFVHPVECLHGDIGVLCPGDIVLALSHSGATEEVCRFVEQVVSRGYFVAAMTGNSSSRLGCLAGLVLSVPVREETGPFGLIPTASTTAAMALGDALALCAMREKGFGREDFALLHPAGVLGRRLTLRVSAVMFQGEDCPVASPETRVCDALFVMTRTRTGAVCVTDPKGILVGFFTDGDLRRRLLINSDFMTKPICEVMTRSPRCVSPELLADDAARIMAGGGFDNMPVVAPQSGALVGLLDERSLLGASY
ncbi:MAG: KpsF/GutQ family sugar-phosphate isomerase [Elusimicrobia bacterium]|nr:MAG: KpsF/GutQ family sugar-phosphate isomerase [Elusimicrobiota bacterium]